MVLALDTNHRQQINISRSCTNKAIDDSITSKHLINQQWVHGRDITMYSIIVNTIAISIVLVATGRAYHIVEYPC